MSKYHINKKGETGECESKYDRCPFGEHFETKKEAQEFFESGKDPFANTGLTKKFKKPLVTPFDESGVTPNVKKYKESLEKISSSINTYITYRKTGFNDDSMIPKTPHYLHPYIQGDADMMSDWKAQNYEKIRQTLVGAMTSYYKDSVFEISDVDCLPDDDEVTELSKPMRLTL